MSEGRRRRIADRRGHKGRSNQENCSKKGTHTAQYLAFAHFWDLNSATFLWSLMIGF